MSETRFKRGFYRRSANNILNPAKEECESYTSSMKEKHSEHANRRSDFLRHKDTANGKMTKCSVINQVFNGSTDRVLVPCVGYNLITGEKYNNYQEEVHRGRRVVGDGMSSFTMKQGKNTLRESAARYHVPLGSGPKFEYRQNVLLNEGVFADR
jgi:hypothetical protein